MRIEIASVLMSLIGIAGCQETSQPDASKQPAPDVAHIGQVADGQGTIVSTRQLIRPIGQVLEAPGRPVDLVASADGKKLYVKDRSGINVIDVATWKVVQSLSYQRGGASMHGIVLRADGKRIYVTTTNSAVLEMTVKEDGTLERGKTFAFHANVKGNETDAYPCGIALSADGARAYVCLSMNNSLAVVDLEGKEPIQEIPVGVAPYGVVLGGDGNTAYVTNWGGRRPAKGEKVGDSAGTAVVIDEHGSGSSGTVGVIDLRDKKMVKEIATGLHPAQIVMSSDAKTLYVANANSDSVSVIDVASGAVSATIGVRPDDRLPFGSASNALALSADGKILFVANGGNNAIAVVKLEPTEKGGHVAGFIPAGWYPGALAMHDDSLFVANVKGIGSRLRNDQKAAFNSRNTIGTVQRVPLSIDEATLAAYTAQVRSDALVPQSLAAWEKGQADQKPAPIPQRIGEPSVFEHIVYVIKENRTYDQVFGDIGKGNSDPALCIYGQAVTPNQHALAEQYVLLDNYYCNGVLSADGHAWATEGVAVDYLEKSFGGWSRSYPAPGVDALAVAPTGFIWDNVLLHQKSFRNYGETFDTAVATPQQTWTTIYQDFAQKAGKVKFKHDIPTEALKTYSCVESPGWNLKISDQIRADAFLTEFRDFEKNGQLPNFVMLYLPQDHTSGTTPGQPKPAAMVADNDLALGRVVDAISHSKDWATTCIFVIEDDPQDGFDHVDGHRSTCLVISPYTKRKEIVSDFYNQTSVLHTMELILGLPPMNQMDAMAPVMRACFTDKPDLAPYVVEKNQVALDELNPEKRALNGKALKMAEQSLAQDFEKPDHVNEDVMNRILWHASKGIDAAYPAAFAGAHGKGLSKLKLKLDGRPVEKDDDDD